MGAARVVLCDTRTALTALPLCPCLPDGMAGTAGCALPRGLLEAAMDG